MSAVRVLLLLGAVLSTGALRVVQQAPDGDHLLHEAVDNADSYPKAKPTTSNQKEFLSLDKDGDGHLTMQELMFRQFASGCEASESQIRSMDYMICGDSDKDNQISAKEFDASMGKPWLDCIMDRADRRAHGFMRFFDADLDFDDKVTATELRLSLQKLWGPPGEKLAKPFMACADTNKDKVIDQDEFHDTISFYNPNTRKFQGQNGKVLSCMDQAMVDFDTRLAFHATDANGDGKVSRSEAYSVITQMAPKIAHDKVVAMFTAADLDKDNFLSEEEFKQAGESYKGANEANLLLSGAGEPVAAAAKVEEARKGMAAACSAHLPQQWAFFTEAKNGTVSKNGTLDKSATAAKKA